MNEQKLQEQVALGQIIGFVGDRGDCRERIDQYIIAGKSAQAEISHGAKQNESS